MPSQVDQTIVFLSHNQAAYVEAAVRSVLSQDCRRVEILISDDCSSDGSYEILQDVVRDYAGPHVVTLNRNPLNMGITAHLNRCVELSKGDVLIVAAGDDISVPDRARKIIETFKRTNALLVHSRVGVISPDSGPLDDVHSSALFFRTNAAVDAARSMALYIGATGAWHKDIFRRYGPLPVGDCYEDLILGLRAALEGRIAFIDEPLVHYRQGVGVSYRDAQHGTEDWSVTRLKTLQRHRVALAQRLIDARTFGLGEDSEIVRVLQKQILMGHLRSAVHVQSNWRFLRMHLDTPADAIRALLSERRRTRRAHRATRARRGSPRGEQRVVQ